MILPKLKLDRNGEFEYVLKDIGGAEQGRITANYYSGDYIQIVRFCVAKKYRSSEDKISKGKYGRKLLNAIIDEAKYNPQIVRIEVIPKGEELYDDIVPMKTELVCKKYRLLGFDFETKIHYRDYEKKMILWLKNTDE